MAYSQSTREVGCSRSSVEDSNLCDVLNPRIIRDKVPNKFRCARWSAHLLSVFPKRAAKPRSSRSPRVRVRAGVGRRPLAIWQKKSTKTQKNTLKTSIQRNIFGTLSGTVCETRPVKAPRRGASLLIIIGFLQKGYLCIYRVARVAWEESALDNITIIVMLRACLASPCYIDTYYVLL